MNIYDQASEQGVCSLSDSLIVWVWGSVLMKAPQDQPVASAVVVMFQHLICPHTSQLFKSFINFKLWCQVFLENTLPHP